MESREREDDGKEDEVTSVEVDVVKDLYRRSKVKCGVMCREVPRT